MLEKIVADTRRRLEAVRQRQPLSDLLSALPSKSAPPSLAAAITRPALNIIAEIKYCSPSHGPFACNLSPEQLAKAYREAGAAAISVLTESDYFKGSLQDLQRVRTAVDRMPLLRKDFIVDPYQVVEARLHGASAVLLIVACLGRDEVRGLSSTVADQQLECLVEVHDLYELETAMEAEARIIGVNNRDLKSFGVDVNTSFEIARRLEGETGIILVSESGIHSRSQIQELRDAGFSAFLIGSFFMDSPDPGGKLRELLGDAST